MRRQIQSLWARFIQRQTRVPCSNLVGDRDFITNSRENAHLESTDHSQHDQEILEHQAEMRATNDALRQEIVHRQQVEAQLKESEARLRNAIANAPFPIIIHNEDGKILRMSQAIGELTG